MAHEGGVGHMGACGVLGLGGACDAWEGHVAHGRSVWRIGESCK